MKASELRKKSTSEMNDELISLRRQQFNLRMQKATGNPKTTDFLKVRRDIARIKTVINEIKSGDA